MTPVEILAAYGAIWAALTIAGLLWVVWVYRDKDYPEMHTSDSDSDPADLDDWR